VVGWFAAGIPYHSFAHKLFRHDDDFDDPHAALKGVGLFFSRERRRRRAPSLWILDVLIPPYHHPISSLSSSSS
jgi:hypothetical protein